MNTISDGEYANYSEILYCEELHAQKRYDELISDFSERRRAILAKRDWPSDRRKLEQAAKQEEVTNGASTAENQG
ncbi:hypothetical protein ACFLUS_01665 [Chloroflexota bacterium]